MARPRLTVVSHPAVVGVNRAPYRELARLGWDVTLIVPAEWRSDWGGRPMRAAEGGDSPYRVVPLRVRLSGSIPLHHYGGASLRTAIARSRPDVVHVEEEPYSTAGYQAARVASALGVPFCVYSAQNMYRPYPWPFGPRERWVLSRAAAVLGITTEVSEVVARKTGRSGAAVVPLWVDVPAPDPSAVRAFRDRWAPSGGFVVGFAGRLVRQKGVDVLAQAFVRAAIDDAVLSFVGSGPMHSELVSALTTELGSGYGDRVRFEGALPHAAMPPALAAMDVLVLPSITLPRSREQFGRVLVEAAIHGTALVGTPTGWIPNLLRELDGACVPESDADALARALVETRAAARDPRVWSTRAAARRQAALRYRVDSVASQMDAVFRGALAAHAPAETAAV